MLPMFGWEVIERQQRITVLGPFGDGLVVFHAVSGGKEVERGLGVDTGLHAKS
ncbi:MAG: hypothetical protein ACJAVT_002635 [Yoonia sp.]